VKIVEFFAYGGIFVIVFKNLMNRIPRSERMFCVVPYSHEQHQHDEAAAREQGRLS
jgi:hypothetical protein